MQQASDKPRLVLVGNGMAGVRTLEELLKLTADKYRITVFGAEPRGNYNRILLSPLLAGDKSEADIVLNDLDWYAERGIRLHAGKTVTAIDRQRRQVIASDGTAEGYDRLLLATGSTPFLLPIRGAELPGVVSFRTLDDVQTMLTAAQGGGHAAVIGGGLLGLEAAYGLRKRGMQVSVVHVCAWLMERQVDAAAGELLKRRLEEAGLEVRLNAKTVAILGTEHVSGIAFEDGDTLPADLVVMAAGIRANIELAQNAGLRCERGIVVNDTMQTFDPRIYAVGECVQHRRTVYGLVAPLWEQARVCANHLAEIGCVRYAGSVTATRLKVNGVDVFSAGRFDGGEGSETLIFRDHAQGIYKKLQIKNNRLQGAVLYGDIADSTWYFRLMQNNTDIGPLRDELIFGEAAA